MKNTIEILTTEFSPEEYRSMIQDWFTEWIDSKRANDSGVRRSDHVWVYTYLQEFFTELERIEHQQPEPAMN